VQPSFAVLQLVPAQDVHAGSGQVNTSHMIMFRYSSHQHSIQRSNALNTPTLAHLVSHLRKHIQVGCRHARLYMCLLHRNVVLGELSMIGCCMLYGSFNIDRLRGFTKQAVEHANSHGGTDDLARSCSNVSQIPSSGSARRAMLEMDRPPLRTITALHVTMFRLCSHQWLIQRAVH
jgi:hypothetical protein